MKRLPPAIQEKHRYLEFKIHSEEQDLGKVVDAVWKSALEFMGEKGCAEANFWVIGNKFDEKKQQGVIKVNREREDDLRAALTLIEEISDKKAFVEVTGVSGTMKGLE